MRDQYCHLNGEPHASEYLAGVHDPQELVLSGGLVEQRDLLIDKERVRDPDQSDVLRTNNYITQFLHFVEKQGNQPGIE